MPKVKFFTYLILLTGFIFAIPTQATDNFANTMSAKNASYYTERFIVGGQPNITDINLLAKHQIKTVINLRGQGEFTDFDEKAKVEALGMTYISIPVSGASEVNLDNLRLFRDAIRNIKGKTFVHCASGNRVGAFFALDAYINDKKSAEAAIAIGKKAGLTRLEKRVKEVIDEN